MLYRNIFMKLSVMMLVIAAISGCATQEKSSWDPFQLVWPQPPERPRIKYVDSLSSDEDVSSGGGFATSLFGEGNSEGLSKPYGVTTDERGRVYVSDIGRIFVFDKANKRLSFIGQSGEVKLGRPSGMFYDKKTSLLYVADTQLDRVLAFNPNGNIVLELGRKGELKDPGGVVVDDERNRVYVTNTKRHLLSVFDTKGGFIKDIGQRGSEPGSFNFPTQIAIDSSGNIYVVDSGNFRIQIIDPEGKVIQHMGEVGTALGQFARPKGIALSPEGYIFILDSSFEGVTMFDKNGRLLLTWGNSGFEKGLLQVPAGMHVDEKGRVYIVSQWTGRVDIFQFISYPEDKEQLAPAEKK